MPIARAIPALTETLPEPSRLSLNVKVSQTLQI